MLAFWPDVIRPLLGALAPRAVVEIGSESGKTTRRLVDLLRPRGGVVHAVDPAPRFDADAWVREAGGALVVHRARSLDALPGIADFDAVLVDGDHNWFTVLGELRLVERLARERDRPLPLVLIHDVAWPYGRRDLYYDPEAIPDHARQPWARGGVSPALPDLLPSGGTNAHLCHALREGGPRNGVLTAVEDWLAETRERVDFVRIPAVYGLGIVLGADLARARPEVVRLARAWAVPEIQRFLDRLEVARIAMMAGGQT